MDLRDQQEQVLPPTAGPVTDTADNIVYMRMDRSCVGGQPRLPAQVCFRFSSRKFSREKVGLEVSQF